MNVIIHSYYSLNIYTQTKQYNHLTIYDVLFVKKSLSSEKITPTSNAFEQHILRATYQSYILIQASQQYINVPSPDDHG